jgi:hypothetical protein
VTIDVATREIDATLAAEVIRTVSPVVHRTATDWLCDSRNTQTERSIAPSPVTPGIRVSGGFGHYHTADEMLRASSCRARTNRVAGSEAQTPENRTCG